MIWPSVLLVAWSAGLLGTGPSPSTPQGTPLAIAALRGGNTLVPLGQFVGGRWIRTWPGPDEQVNQKVARMDEIPRAWYPSRGGVPKEWFLWLGDAHGVPIRAVSPKLAEAHCEAVWGLSTRLKPTGHETTAIATSIQAGIRPFYQSTVWAGADQRLRVFLRDQFDNAEAAIQAGRQNADTALSHRSDCDPVYELSCVSTGNEDEELCFFEASRRLGTKPSGVDPGCDEIAVVQGWYRTAPFTLLQVSGLLTDCDAKQLRSSAPLLMVDVGGRSFVVVREHGYEDESFAVFEVHGDELKPVLKVRGGGC